MKTFVAVLTSILLLFVGLVVLAQAEAVGRITQVEGRVDFLKGGKLPAAAAKLNDGVEVGDVLRTKSLSKARITFIDDTVITVSPESRIAVEEYMFDPGKGKRSAILQLFQGLAHVVVSKVFKPAEPDFVVKTSTAVMGVRGTEFGVRLHPNSSTILNFEGHTEVGNIFPEVGDLLFKKAYKIAFSWGGNSTVHLWAMQGTTVFRGLPPTHPFSITAQDRQQFMGQMGSGLSGRGTSSSLTSASLGGPDSGLGSSSSGTGNPTALTTATTTTDGMTRNTQSTPAISSYAQTAGTGLNVAGTPAIISITPTTQIATPAPLPAPLPPPAPATGPVHPPR